MPRVLLLLTFLNAGVVAANPTAGRWNVSAVRRRAAQRRRPRMSASAAYETWTRARIDAPNFDRFADFAGACMRGHDACRAPSDAGQCDRRPRFSSLPARAAGCSAQAAASGAASIVFLLTASPLCVVARLRASALLIT